MAMRRGLRAAVLPDLDDADEVAGPLAERVRELDPRLEPWLPLIGVAFGVEYPATKETEALDPEFAAARMAGALGRLIDVASPPQPMLVLVEDAHWLDGASVGLLRYLLGPDPRPVLARRAEARLLRADHPPPGAERARGRWPA